MGRSGQRLGYGTQRSLKSDCDAFESVWNRWKLFTRRTLDCEIFDPEDDACAAGGVMNETVLTSFAGVLVGEAVGLRLRGGSVSPRVARASILVEALGSLEVSSAPLLEGPAEGSEEESD